MFDTALLESGPSRRVRGKGAGLPLAITAHLVLIGAFVGASAWTVGDPQEPETRIAVFPTFTSFSAAPPPSGGTPPAVPQPRRSNAEVQSTALPPDLPDLPDVPEQNSLPPGSGEPGTETGAPGPGIGPGTEGGTGLAPGIGPGDPGASEPIVYPGGDVTTPVLVTRVEPDYPEAARRALLEGTVIVEAVITSAGDVDDVRILKSVNPLLDAAASQAVRRWRYRPATRNGRAVPVYLTVTVRFSLRS